jgi:hypothetical protein
MTSEERAMFSRVNEITALVGGLPKHVRTVRVSQTMRQDFITGGDVLGLWDPESASIVIRRDQLKSLDCLAGTLLHELAHARTGHDDVTREFENELTALLGMAAASAVRAAPNPPPKRAFWRRK